MKTLEKILTLADREEAFYLLIDFYENASDEDRVFIRDNWDFGKKWIIPDLENLAVKLPNKRYCENRIRASLIYNSFEKNREDTRMTLVSFCVKYHSAKESGLNPDDIFEAIAKISSPEFALELRDFAHRTEEEKSLKAFGWDRLIDENGDVHFKLNW